MAGFKGVVDLNLRLPVEDEEDEGLDFSGVEGGIETDEFKWCLVGKFLTDKNVNCVAVKSVLPPIWKPVKGVQITEAAPNLFLFQFFHERDMRRVIDDGPWTFEFHLFICRQLVVGETVAEVELWDADLWVHILDIPLGLASNKLGEDVGNFLGKFVSHDTRAVRPSEGSSMRVRVSIDVRKPLKRRMKIKRSANAWCWLNFQYERVPMFCFYCGIMGHSEKYCAKYYDNPIPKEMLPYGAEMRFILKKGQKPLSERWLRNSGPVEEGIEVGDDDVDNLNERITGNLVLAKKSHNVEIQNGSKGEKEAFVGKLADYSVSESRRSNQIISKFGNTSSANDVEDMLTIESKRKRSNVGGVGGTHSNGPNFLVSDMIIDPLSYSPAGLDNQAGPKQ
ncbi:uncharacterized protein LOC126657251 [Mercurialis annua]|uniref:uncharacterized protein LOC126657251 n=1 Tax=Mercurialis annua TaxID=3986 RepID=UPI00215EF0C2|nr:uncharacterized protein LOC126657251 [Mercurialis annua]